MLFWILIMVAVLLIGFGIRAKFKDVFMEEEYLVFSLFFAVLVLVLPLTVIHNHAGDLATLEYQGEEISVIEQSLADLNKELVGYQKAVAGALMNHDTPIASLVMAKNNMLVTLVNSRKVVTNTKKSIMQRKLGLWSGALWFFDDLKGIK